jgi:hypothetical protein
MTGSLRWELPEKRQVRPLILEPPRLAIVAGAILTMIGTLTPWATGVDQARNPISFSPFTDPDGVLFVLISIAAPVFALSQSAAESRTRTLQGSTTVVGVVAVLNWLAAVRAGTPPYVAGARVLWIHQQEPGLFIAGAGVALLLIGGSWISVKAWRHNGTLNDPLDVVLTRRSLVNGLIQAGLCVAGFIVGMYASLAAFGPYAILVMTLGALGAGGAGLMLGERISSRQSRSAPGKPARVPQPRRAVWTDNAPQF